MDQARTSFVESSKSHWRYFLRSAKSKELSRAETFQASSIFGYRQNFTKN